MNLKTILYSKYEESIPQQGNIVLGQKRNSNIIVYQAFNDAIANYAMTNQKFGGNSYSLSRMTWIKPNFLWMMYRSGWALKENQKRILAIEVTFEGFQQLLREGVESSNKDSKETEEVWREKLQNSDVRIQWDPDHNHLGEKLKRRAVQIGIKNSALQKFNEEYLVSITDITDFVREQKKCIDEEKDFYVIEEEIIQLATELKLRFDINS